MSAARSFAAFAFGLLLLSCSNGDEERLHLSGVIETTDVALSSTVPGRIVRLAVREGERVEPGDTVAVIDADELTTTAAGLSAAVDAARAQYQLALAGPRPEDIGQAQEALRQATISVESARDDVDRLALLYKEGSVPEKNLIDARNRLALAERGRESARIALQRLRKGTRQEEIAAARSRLDQAEAQLAGAQQRVSDRVILSPVGGIVSQQGFEEGEFAGVGAGIVTISKVEPLRVKVYVPENELGLVQIGQEWNVVTDTWPDRPFRGRVTYISPTAEFTPKNVQTRDERVKLVFEVRIDLPNPKGELKGGMAVEARPVDAPSTAEK